MEFHLFLPQLRLSFDRFHQLCGAAQAREQVGGARVSVQQMVAYVGDEAASGLAANREEASR